MDCGVNRHCIDGLNTFTCVCDDGYTGEHCEVEINECERLNITCSEHGQCMKDASTYRCVCDPHFTGETYSDILDKTQAPDKTLDMQAVLGGTIETVVFLFLLILVAVTMVIVIRKQKKKGRWI